MMSVIAALPCLALAADTQTLGLTGQSFDVGRNASLAPFMMYQSLGQGKDQSGRGLQLHGATSQVSVGASDSAVWTGAFYVSKIYGIRPADGGVAMSPLDISRLGNTMTWFREPAARGAGMTNASLSGAHRQLLGEDRMVFQRLALKAGALSVDGQYLDVGARFQGANNLTGLPQGLDANAVQNARGMDNLNLSAALQVSSNVKITSKLTRVSNLQPGHQQYGFHQRDQTHRLEAKLGKGTNLSALLQTLSENPSGYDTDTKTKTLSLTHTFSEGRTFALTDQTLAESVGGSKTRSHTRTFDVGWTFDRRLKAGATLTDTNVNGAANRTRNLRLNWAANGTAIGLRQVVVSGAGAQTTTSLEVATRLLGGDFKLSRLAVDSQARSRVTDRLNFDGTYGKTRLTLNHTTRSGARGGPPVSTSLKIASPLKLAGTPVTLNANYGRDVVDPKTRTVTDPGASLRLMAHRPGFNLIADLRQRDRGGFGSRVYLVRDPKEVSRFGPWGDLLVAAFSANDMNRTNYEHSMQLGGLRFAVGQRMIARTDRKSEYPAVFTNFDFSRCDLPKWASTLSSGSMFGTDKNYKSLAVMPGVQPATGKAGLRFGLSRLSPGGGSGLVQTLDYAVVLSREYFLRLYLGRAAGNVPTGAPARSRLVELSSRYHGKLSWVVRFTSDSTDQGDCASQVFGLRGGLSVHETLALTLLRQSVIEGGGSAFGLDYSRHVSDDHYLELKAQYDTGARGSGYRVDVAYQKQI